MKSFEIAGTKREARTKQETKKLRNEGRVLCVLYGGKENVHFSAPVLDFKKLVYTPEVQTVKINVDGNSYDAVMREIQFHPVTDALLHIDFMEINPENHVIIDVPVKITGASEGVKQGGRLISKMRKLKIKALPKDLPDHITIDVTALNIGQSVRVNELEQKGVEFLDSPNNVIVGVRVTRNVVETPAEGAPAAAAGVAPAAAAAPAPAAKPAK
jgi:large subunit ribosomal protein L25